MPAVRNDGPPRSEETICQGGTFSFEGLEMSFTPVDNVDWTTSALVDFTPRLLTRSCTFAGPLLLTVEIDEVELRDGSNSVTQINWSRFQSRNT